MPVRGPLVEMADDALTYEEEFTMTDLQFGLSVTPEAAGIDNISTLVNVAEEKGLDLIAIQDHPYNRQFLDTWTLITYLAARTQRIRFFPDVVDLPMRPPAMLAKAVASLDRLTGGRIELGLGGGAFWDAIVAMGGERRTPGEAVEATEEAIRVIRLAWGTERGVRFEGQHYHLRGYQPGPTPAHSIGIWLGVAKPRMLRLTGRLADGWVSPLNIYVPPEQVPPLQTIIDEAALDAGRKPSDIRRIYNVLGTIDPAAAGDNGLNGSVDMWVETLTRWTTDLGFDTFIFWPSVPGVEQVERFALEVVPQVREAVANQRQ